MEDLEENNIFANKISVYFTKFQEKSLKNISRLLGQMVKTFYLSYLFTYKHIFKILILRGNV